MGALQSEIVWHGLLKEKKNVLIYTHVRHLDISARMCVRFPINKGNVQIACVMILNRDISSNDHFLRGYDAD